MHEQNIVSMKDLRFATLTCAHCQTRVTLDMGLQLQRSDQKPFEVPRDCPRCKKAFDSAIPKAVEDMQKVYRAVVDVQGISFTGQP